MSSKARNLRDSSVWAEHLQPHLRNRRGVTNRLSEVQTVTETDVTEIIEREIGARQEAESERRMLIQIINAERRAKAFAAGFSRRFRHQIDLSKTFTFGTWDPIAYDVPTLRSVGARSVGDVTSSAGKFEHYIPKGSQGTWFYHASIMVAFTAMMNMAEARIGIFRNGVLYSTRDAVDVGYAGENPIQDVVLHISDLVVMDVGDTVTFRVYFDNGGGGDQLFLAPTSVQGHVLGFRVNCDTEEVGSVTGGNGSGYTFT